MTDRRYQMMRVAAGDYLLLSNDATTLWRLRRYREDGTLSTLQPDGSYRDIRGWFWAASYFDGTLEQAHASLLRELDGGDDDGYRGWLEWHSLLPTRGEAIQAALAAAPLVRL